MRRRGTHLECESEEAVHDLRGRIVLFNGCQ
jgi:hypothetical protein